MRLPGFLFDWLVQLDMNQCYREGTRNIYSIRGTKLCTETHVREKCLTQKVCQ